MMLMFGYIAQVNKIIYNGYVNSWCGRDGYKQNIPKYDSYIQGRHIDWQTSLAIKH